MLVHLSDGVLEQVLKLEAIEEGRLGNYTRVEKKVDMLRYKVADLVMGSVMSSIRFYRK